MLHPEDPEPLLAMADAYAADGMALDSRVHYQRAYEAYQRRGDTAAAQALKARANFGPEDLDADFVKRTLQAAESNASSGDTRKAEECFNRVADRFPDSTRAREGLRTLYRREARFADASRESLRLAEIYRQSGDADRAQEATREAERLDPDNPAVWIEHGIEQDKKHEGDGT